MSDGCEGLLDRRIQRVAGCYRCLDSAQGGVVRRKSHRDCEVGPKQRVMKDETRGGKVEAERKERVEDP